MSARKKARKLDPDAPVGVLTFKSHVYIAHQKNEVTELLTCGGSYPNMTIDQAETADWQHVLMEANASLFEYLRFDTNDPANQFAILKKLALIAAIAETWGKTITGE